MKAINTMMFRNGTCGVQPNSIDWVLLGTLLPQPNFGLIVVPTLIVRPQA